MKQVRAAVAFSAVVGRSLVRDRSALFFMLVLPVVIIVIIGTTFGGQDQLRLGVLCNHCGAEGRRVVDTLRHAEGVKVTGYRDAGALEKAVRNFTVSAGLEVPAGFDEQIRSGRAAEVTLLAAPGGDNGFSAQTTVRGVLAGLSNRISAARFVTRRAGTSFESALDAAQTAGGSSLRPQVRVENIGGAARNLSRFSLTAPQNLVLFVFINALASSVLLVQARRQGTLRRAFATPAGLGTLLVGVGLGWFLLALAQSLLIVGVGSLLFGVRWGDPAAAALLVVVWAAVGCGGGLLLGALARSQERVGALAPITGVVLGALGGCMVPLEVFPSAMKGVAHAIPHYWAILAWQKLVFDGSGVGAIATSLIVLGALAVVLVAAATVVLRRDLAGR